MMLTRDQLLRIMPHAGAKVDEYLPHLQHYMAEYGIDDGKRAAAFLAQVAHESGELQRVLENLNYSAQGLRATFKSYFTTDELAAKYARKPQAIANRVYANRMGNGDEASGDGWRYRGRGLIQVTGRDNYATCSKALGVDLVAKPELLETPQYAVASACWFWWSRNLSQLADRGQFVSISRRINGGTNGLPERIMYHQGAQRALGVA